jgi:ABC-2 type transport system permease protein
MNLPIYLVAYLAIVRKEVFRVLRIWQQTILPSAVTMSLYFIVFGSLIGPRVGDMDGTYFMDFIAPGLIMMAVITNSYSNVVSSFFGAKFQKNVEEMLVAPVPSPVIILGFVTGGVFRGLLVGLLVTMVSMFFTQIQVNNLFVILSTVLLTSVVFALAGFLNGIFAKKFDDVSIVPTFILTPLTYLGGVFYSITLLPSFWQGVSMLNPILYMVNAFRYGFLGVTDINVWFGLSILVVFVIAFFSACWYLMQKGYGIKS